MLAQQIRKGDCETCDATDVKLTSMHGNMLMCDTCVTSERDTLAKNTQARKVIEDARKTDATVELKQDLFLLGAVAFTELQAAIQQNTEIPDAQKNFAIMTEVSERIKKFDAVIFAEEQSLLAKKNERHALLVNAQNFAARLHETEKQKFKQFDINYKPPQVKVVKPSKSGYTPKKYNKAALYEAAKKYGVEQFVAQVQSLIVSNSNMTPDDAAQEMARLMGKL